MGDNTLDADMTYLSGLNQVWTYSGGAEGTYWTNTGGIDMSGSFNASVNFSLPVNQITEFNLAVAGGGHSASVAGASGSFEGTSHFNLGGGAAFIDSDPESVPNGNFTAYGSVYGPAAQAIGGVWSIEDSGNTQHAAGIFHGDKKGETAPPEEI